jgi:hypothetical protein
MEELFGSYEVGVLVSIQLFSVMKTTFRVSPLSGVSLYYAAFFVFSALGLCYDGYFYCFHLFHVIIGNEVLLRVLKVSEHRL